MPISPANTGDPLSTRSVLIQFHRFKDGGRQVWRNYFSVWLRHGHRPVFWSNLNCGTHSLPAPSFLPEISGKPNSE